MNPTVVIEVLSKSTEVNDRGYKFGHYRRLESLREYVMVSQTEPSVEVYRRRPHNEWTLYEYSGLEGTCRFEAIDCNVPASEIFRQVSFDAPPKPRTD